MITLLNGKPTSFPSLKNIMVGRAPDQVNLTHYQDHGNTILFEPIALRYGEDIVSVWGENELWEMIQFENLTQDSRVTFSEAMYDFIKWTAKGLC